MTARYRYPGSEQRRVDLSGRRPYPAHVSGSLKPGYRCGKVGDYLSRFGWLAIATQPT